MSPFIRAHSSTRQASASAASRRMCGVDTGDPISSSGFATNTSRAKRQPARELAASAAIAWRPASSPLFMSVTPGPVAIPSRTVYGRSAAVPGSNTVSMCPMHSTVGPSGVGPDELADDRVAEALLVGVAGHGGAQAFEPLPRPAAHLVDARLRVRAAVDVDEALEVGEVVGLGPLDGGAEGLEVGRGNEAAGRWGHGSNLPDDEV